MTCATPIEDGALVDYWLGEPTLGDDEQDAIELHVLGCASCTERLERTVAVLDGMRAIAGASVNPVVPRRVVDEQRAAGVLINQVHASAAHVDWRVDDSEIYVIVFPVDLTQIERVDIEYCHPDGTVQALYRAAPFDAAAGELILCCDRHVATAHEQLRFRVLGARSGARERVVLGDCTVRSVRP